MKRIHLVSALVFAGFSATALATPSLAVLTSGALDLPARIVLAGELLLQPLVRAPSTGTVGDCQRLVSLELAVASCEGDAAAIPAQCRATIHDIWCRGGGPKRGRGVALNVTPSSPTQGWSSGVAEDAFVQEFSLRNSPLPSNFGATVAARAGSLSSALLGQRMDLWRQAADGPLDATNPAATFEAPWVRARETGLAALDQNARTLVTSCSDYAYKRFFPYMRAVDVIRANPEAPGLVTDELGDNALRYPFEAFGDADSLAAGSTRALLEGSAAGPNAAFSAPSIRMPRTPRDPAILRDELPRNPFLQYVAPEVLGRLPPADAARVTKAVRERGKLALTVAAGRRLNEFELAPIALGEIRGRVPTHELHTPADVVDVLERTSRYARLLQTETALRKAIACLDEPQLPICGSDDGEAPTRATRGEVNARIAVLLGRAAEDEDDYDFTTPSWRTNVDELVSIRDPMRAFYHAREFAALSTVLADPRAHAPGVMGSYAAFKTVADGIFAERFLRPAPVAGGSSASPSFSAANALNVGRASLLVAKKPPLPRSMITPAQLAALTPASLDQLTPELAARLNNLTVADARLLSDAVLMRLPTKVLSKVAALDGALAARMGQWMAERDARRAALVDQLNGTYDDEAVAIKADLLRPETTSCLWDPPHDANYGLGANWCDVWPYADLERRATMLRASVEQEYDRCVSITGRNDFGLDHWTLKRPDGVTVTWPSADFYAAMKLPNLDWDVQAPSIVLNPASQRKRYYPSWGRGSGFSGFRMPTLGRLSNGGLDFQNLPRVDLPGASLPGVGPVGMPRFFDALTMADFLGHIDAPDAWLNAQIGDLQLQASGITAKLGSLPRLDFDVDLDAISLDGLDPQTWSLREPFVDDLRTALGVPGVGTAFRSVQLGSSKADGEGYGDPNWFWGGWDYSWRWTVRPKFAPKTDRVANPDPRAAATETLAGLEGDVNAEARLRAAALGSAPFTIVAVSARANAAFAAGDTGVAANASLKVVGQELLTVSYTATNGFVVKTTGAAPRPTNLSTMRVPLWWFELVFSADYDVNASARPVLAPSRPQPFFSESSNPLVFGLSATVEPQVVVKAIGSAVVSIAGAGAFVGAGARIYVDVLDLAVPMSVDARLEGLPKNPLDLALNLQSTADVRVQSLKGRVDAYAYVGVEPWRADYSATLFRWEGYEKAIPILRAPLARIPLGDVSYLFAFPAVRGAGESKYAGLSPALFDDVKAAR